MNASKPVVAVIDLGDFSCQRSAMYGHQPYGLRSIHSRPLFLRMARRLSDCELLDDVYIVGSNVPTHVLTSGLAGVRSIALPTVHLCERLAAAADDSNAEWLVYVPANRPFVDPELVDQLLAQTLSATSDYVGFASVETEGSRVEDIGLAGEVCHADAVRRLRRNADRLVDQPGQSLLDCMSTAPGAYHLKFVPLPSKLDRRDLRFSISDEADWEDAQVLCDSVTPDDSQWQELAELVMGNENIRDSMARRNEDESKAPLR